MEEEIKRFMAKTPVIRNIRHNRDKTKPADFLLRALLHTPHGILIGLSPYVHWGLTIGFVSLFIMYEQNEDLHLKDQPWKDYYGALVGIVIGGTTLAILKILDIISI